MLMLTIGELALPESIGAPDAGDFIEMVRIRNDIEAYDVGTRDFAVEPEELLAIVSNPYELRRFFLARVDGRIVGRAVYQLQGGLDVPTAWVSVEILPEFRRQGLGSALYTHVHAIALEDGRTAMQAESFHHVPPAEPVIISPTGFGAVSADDAPSRFLVSRGFRLAQVNRVSRLALPSGAQTPEPAAGYDLEAWEGSTPQHRLSDMAVLHARMSTDPPAGEVDWQPETWDEQRVVEHERRRDTDGRRYLTVAARHIESDSLVGFSDLSVPPEVDRPVQQEDTIVLHEHRGHRLGMLLKAANLQRLDELAPGHPAIYTWNAEENRPMLTVNEAVGFVPVAVEASWRTDLN
ncbi:GNAT family N-acetyltransferase [Salinibacterium hongtaonis]|nr:GNAT family N-acetyltransferase [Salinibacterium hongtaonis]